MTENGEIKKLTADVTSLQKDMAQIGTLVDRLDITIEKLTEVSTTVSQLLAVQGNRLEFQEKAADKIQELIEKRRLEVEQITKEINSRIEKVERELQVDMEDNNNKVITEIKELRLESISQNKELNERIGRIEKWMWVLVGGGFVIGLILNNINVANIWG